MIYIRKGDTFLCIKDFHMEDGDISYTKGRVYTSNKDGSLRDDDCDIHYMDGVEDFYDYFYYQGNEITNSDNYRNIECMDAMEAAVVNKLGIEAVCTANIIRYIWKYESENGIEDVKKAKEYFDKLLGHLENKNKK